MDKQIILYALNFLISNLSSDEHNDLCKDEDYCEEELERLEKRILKQIEELKV